MTLPNSLSALKTARAASGTRYAAAIAELEAAYIELAAYDRALNNANVIKMSTSPTAYPTYSEFPGGAASIPGPLRHPQFGTYSLDWRGQINATADQLIASLSN